MPQSFVSVFAWQSHRQSHTFAHKSVNFAITSGVPGGVRRKSRGCKTSFREVIQKIRNLVPPQRLSQVWILVNYDGGVSDQLRLTEEYRARTRLGIPALHPYHNRYDFDFTETSRFVRCRRSYSTSTTRHARQAASSAATKNNAQQVCMMEFGFYISVLFHSGFSWWSRAADWVSQLRGQLFDVRYAFRFGFYLIGNMSVVHVTRPASTGTWQWQRVGQWTWIGSIGGLDWIRLGGMTVTQFLISNHCSTVDAVSFKLRFVNFF